MLKENDHIGTPVKPYMVVFFSANLLNSFLSCRKTEDFIKVSENERNWVVSGNVFAYTDTCLRQGRTDFEERREKKFPYYGILPLILTLTANFIAYFGTRPFTSSWKHYNIETVLDQQIPVIPWTIVIYFGCYLVWIVNYLIAASREKEFVWRFFAADVLARLVCMAFYLLLPTTNVRPSIPEQGFWNQMLALLYQMDAADNLFPSIHCLNSWFCYIAVRSRREIPRWYQRFSFWAALAVFVSTLTTKQHVIADVIGGALLAEVTWQIAGRTHLGAWYGMILERRRWKRRAE